MGPFPPFPIILGAVCASHRVGGDMPPLEGGWWPWLAEVWSSGSRSAMKRGFGGAGGQGGCVPSPELCSLAPRIPGSTPPLLCDQV